MTTVYTCKKKQNTEEYHIFEATVSKDDPSQCKPARNSICRRMTTAESSGNLFACQSEKSAREKAAAKGRSVCGTCVSHLYETYNSK